MKSNWKPYAALASLCLLWGTTYLAIRIGMQEHFPPFLYSGLRFVVAGGLVLLWFLFTGRGIGFTRSDLKRILVSGLLIFPGGNLFLVLAEQTVSSGLAALFNAAFPLWIVVITRLWNPGEKTPLLALAGIITGFAGQWLIFYEHLFAPGETVLQAGLVLLVLGVINGSIGSIHMKKYPIGLHPVLTGAWQMFLCGSITALAGIFKGEWSQLPHTLPGWWSMLYLVVAGSIFGYSLFVYALRYLPAQQVSVYAYVNPLVAVFLGWLLLDEQISTRSIGAMGITILGVFLVNKGMQAAKKA
ncbi:MAG: EamA family transporter [Bacteroidia bacterium]|nr:EamA family transporter [Bacteroidia bacterium]